MRTVYVKKIISITDNIEFSEKETRAVDREVLITKVKTLLENDRNLRVLLADNKIYTYGEFKKKFKDYLPIESTKRLIDHKITTRVTFEELQKFRKALDNDGGMKAQHLLHDFILDYIKKHEV